MKNEKIISIFVTFLIISVFAFTAHLVYAAYTKNIEREMTSISTITDVANPTFTGSISLQANDGSELTCNADAEGTIYANSDEHRLKLCNGSSWVWLEY